MSSEFQTEYPAVCKLNLADPEFMICPTPACPAAVPTQLMAPLSFLVVKPEALGSSLPSQKLKPVSSPAVEPAVSTFKTCPGSSHCRPLGRSHCYLSSELLQRPQQAPGVSPGPLSIFSTQQPGKSCSNTGLFTALHKPCSGQCNRVKA